MRTVFWRQLKATCRLLGFLAQDTVYVVGILGTVAVVNAATHAFLGSDARLVYIRVDDITGAVHLCVLLVWGVYCVVVLIRQLVIRERLFFPRHPRRRLA